MASFSYIDSGGGTIFLAVMGNQIQNVYVGFSGGPSPGKVIELNVPELSLVSSYSPPQGTPNAGFEAIAAAVSPSRSLWLTGVCGPCSLGNLISPNAFELSPTNPGAAAFLLELTDVTIRAVANAASFLAGPISPGELVTITGSALGPTNPASLMLDQAGKVATSLGGVQVLFGGIPAPLIYASSGQINAVVPYEIQGPSSPSVLVSSSGQMSNVFQLLSAPAAPALFTA